MSRRDRGGLADRLAPEVLRRARRGLARVAGARRHRRAARPGAARRWRRCARRCGSIAPCSTSPTPTASPCCAATSATTAAEELSFDEEAWRLAVAAARRSSCARPRRWLVENPFTPPARDWVILPLVTGEREMVGVVIASAAAPIRIDPLQRDRAEPARHCSCRAGITTARLRRELQARGDGARAAPRSPPRSTTGSRSTWRWRAASWRCRTPDTRAPARGRRRRPPARPRPAAGPLRRDAARRPAPGDRGRRAPRPRRPCASAATARPGRRPVTLAARVVSRGAGQRRRARAARTRVEIVYAADRRAARADRPDDGDGFDPASAPGRRGRPPRPDRDARARARPRRRLRHHLHARRRNTRHPMDSALESAIAGPACPHVAMLLLDPRGGRADARVLLRARRQAQRLALPPLARGPRRRRPRRR